MRAELLAVGVIYILGVFSLIAVDFGFWRPPLAGVTFERAAPAPAAPATQAAPAAPASEDTSQDSAAAPADDGAIAALTGDAQDQTATRDASDVASSDAAAPSGLSTGDAGGYNVEGGHPDNANLRTNSAGVSIITASEGLRLEAYQGPAGHWLIGYGHSAGVTPGMTITEDQAVALLREDLAAFEEGVKRVVEVPVNENQFSALVSLAYNLGVGGFSGTTVVEALNRGDYAQAADNFRNHDRARINGVRQSVPHLTERRAAERELFLTPA